MASPEFPKDLFEEKFASMFSDERPSDVHFLRQGSRATLDESRRVDIQDTFDKFRTTVEDMLTDLGIDKPEAVNEATLFVAFQERNGFESGVGFVHDNAHVTSNAEAERQSSVLHNMKTAGH